jgi:ankyrin repeat protein
MTRRLEGTKNPYRESFNLHDAATMCVNDYSQHLMQVVTKQQRQIDRHFYDNESYDYNMNIFFRSNKNIITTDPDSEDDSCDTHPSSCINALSIPEKIDYLMKEMNSKSIYFDINHHCWKIHSTTRHKPTVSNNDHFKFQITFDKLIQQFYFMKNDGLDRNTLLLQAIEIDATDVAMDIIRMDHNTHDDYMRGDTDEDDENYHRSLRYATIRSFTSLETPNSVGVTPLIMAIQTGNMTIVQALLRCHISILYASSKQYTSSALFQAAHYGRTQMMEYLIEHFHKVCYFQCDFNRFIDFKNKNGTTPLMRAAQEGHLSTVKLLLKHKADRNMQNKIGLSPLMFAAQRGHTEICQLLIKYGADIDAATDRDVNALLLACKRGHVAIVKALVTAGCDLLHTNNEELTAQQVIQRRIHKRHFTLPERHNNNRSILPQRTLFEIRSGDDGDGRMNDHDDVNIFAISNSTDAKLLFLLRPDTQFQLIQRLQRNRRNFEICRIHRLLQEERADIDFKEGSTCDIVSALQKLEQLTQGHGDTDPTMTMSTTDQQSHLPQQKRRLTGVPLIFSETSTQTLLRIMLLSEPLVQKIALFLPLPKLWCKKTVGLHDYESLNETMVYALDFIDEILEEGGILSAFAQAKIPAPSPHRTWCDWKRSARPNGSWMDLNDEGNWTLPYHNPYHIRRSSITTSSVPSFRDKSTPTLCELRRSVGYSTVLSQNQSLTNIVSILEDTPYHMPRHIIDRLILMADVASICRRCCIEPYQSTLMRSDIQSGIHFDSSATDDIIDLIYSLKNWYETQTSL